MSFVPFVPVFVVLANAVGLGVAHRRGLLETEA